MSPWAWFRRWFWFELWYLRRVALSHYRRRCFHRCREPLPSFCSTGLLACSCSCHRVPWRRKDAVYPDNIP
jgi:hypothetical protein